MDNVQCIADVILGGVCIGSRGWIRVGQRAARAGSVRDRGARLAVANNGRAAGTPRVRAVPSSISGARSRLLWSRARRARRARALSDNFLYGPTSRTPRRVAGRSRSRRSRVSTPSAPGRSTRVTARKSPRQRGASTGWTEGPYGGGQRIARAVCRLSPLLGFRFFRSMR